MAIRNNAPNKQGFDKKIFLEFFEKTAIPHFYKNSN